MADRISASDEGYTTGNLSVFPEALDSFETLYKVSNNAKTRLKQTVSYNGKVIIVDDTTDFPDSGIIRIGSSESDVYELVYYSKKTSNTFQDLKRGFAGSRQSVWSPANVFVSNSVSADVHNAVKDALINMETDLGILVDPAPASLNGILKYQETRFLAPKPLFRSFPIKGPPPLRVRFQNYTTGHTVRYLWDFGDGGTSLEKSPVHTYVTEGKYTVRLNVITSTGAQGIATKRDYIEVNKDEAPPFFYVESVASPYSSETAAKMTDDGSPTIPKEFIFVDQTDGDIVQRNWIYGDGTFYSEEDPDIHTATHTFNKPGNYLVSLLVIFSNGRPKRMELPELLSVL